MGDVLGFARPREDMTPARRKVLNFVAGYIESQGFPPAIEDARAAKIKAARKHIERLIEDGYIERMPGVARGLRVLRMPQAEAEPVAKVLLFPLPDDQPPPSAPAAKAA